MKIAFVVRDFPKLSETFILNQIKGLIDDGHEVKIYSINQPEEEKEHEIIEEYDLKDKTTHFNPPLSYAGALQKTPREVLNFLKREKKPLEILKLLKHGKFAPRKISALEKFTKTKEEFDIIHFHFGTTAKQHIHLKNHTDAKIVTSFYGYDVSSKVHPDNYEYYRDLWDEIDLPIAITQHIRSKMILLGCEEEDSEVINLGVDPEKFKVNIKDFEKGENLKIASVCRFVEKKGIKYAIKAVSELKEEYSDIQYVLAGDGPLREELEGEVDKYDLGKNVEFRGWVDQNEVGEILNDSHVFLQPSVTSTEGDMEGQALVLQEAQAKGTPIVSSYHNGIPEGVIESKTGFLAPERDSHKIKNKIRKFVENPSLVSEMGEEGRKNIEENFDYRDKILEQITKYQRLID